MDKITTHRKFTFTLIDKIFFAFLFLLPLIPRPTIDHPLKFLAPLLVSTVLFAFFLWLLAHKSLIIPKYSGIGIILSSVLIISLLYSVRVIINGEWDELPHLVSKILTFLMLISFLIWMLVRKVPIKTLYSGVFYGFLVLSLLIIFIGITGIPLFGELRPPREYGIVLPFYQTVAIPRSHEEYGIFASAALAYFLIYRNNYKKVTQVIFGSILLLSIAISQSRSTYLAVVLITISYFMINLKVTRRFFPIALLILAIGLPSLIALLQSSLHDIPIVNMFIGEGVLEKNIYVRLDLNLAATDLLSESPLRSLFGISHSQWMPEYSRIGIYKFVHLHNHFLSNIIFLGLIGGSLNLLLYLIPVVSIIKNLPSNNKSLHLIFLVTVGTITCLQFYEGFYSIITTFILSTLWVMSYRLKAAKNTDKIHFY
jgi:hypothetical protein